MSAVREALPAFVRAAQESQDHQHTLYLMIGSPGTNATRRLSLTFGRGYFQPDMVVAWLGEELPGEAETEEAVSACVEGREPEIQKR